MSEVFIPRSVAEIQAFGIKIMRVWQEGKWAVILADTGVRFKVRMDVLT